MSGISDICGSCGSMIPMWGDCRSCIQAAGRNEKFDQIIRLERRARDLRLTGFEWMSDHQYAQRVTALKDAKKALFDAIGGLSSQEMEAFGLYRVEVQS